MFRTEVNLAVLDLDNVVGAAELGDLVVGDDLDPLEVGTRDRRLGPVRPLELAGGAR